MKPRPGIDITIPELIEAIDDLQFKACSQLTLSGEDEHCKKSNLNGRVEVLNDLKYWIIKKREGRDEVRHIHV